MPHLTQDLVDGKAIVDLFVSISGHDLKLMEAAGVRAPQMQHLRAIIDTGASHTCIDTDVFKRLDLEPVAQTKLSTVSTGAEPITADVFEVALVVPHPKERSLIISRIKVTAVQVSAGRELQAILGRDVLARCRFLYDGTAGKCVLSW